MESLGAVFMEAWHASPSNDSDTQWDAGVQTEIWDEQEVSSLVYIMKNWQILFQEVEDLNNQYNDISKTRKGLMVLGRQLRDLQTHSQKFKVRRLNIIEVLPRAIETTAQQYHEAYKKEYANFVAADKVQDQSRMLVKGNHFSCYQTLKLRMKAQIMIYQAADLPEINQMNKIQKEAINYADNVSRELLDWQQQQQGLEVEKLQRQQMKQNEERRKNEEKMAQDKERWNQRRKQIDLEREQRRLRLIELRKVDN
jgi:hypothetical protein